MSQRVKEESSAKKAAENLEGFYELFSAVFVSLTHFNLSERSAAASPGPRIDGTRNAPFEVLCFPGSQNSVVSFQMTGKRFQSEIMPRLVLCLTSTPPVLTPGISDVL